MEYPEFPDGIDYTTIREILSGKTAKSVKIRGWIYRTRSSGNLAFVVVRDSTGIIQCTISKDKVDKSDFDGASKALIESSVIIEGKPVKDDRAPGGWEIRATKFEVFHFAETFPIKNCTGWFKYFSNIGSTVRKYLPSKTTAESDI